MPAGPNKNASTETTRVITSGSSVKIETPQGRRQRKPKVTVFVQPDELVRGQAAGFVNFLREHAVVGLAVGFVIGAQAQTVVKQLTSSFIEPLFALLFGGQKISAMSSSLTFRGRTQVFTWGALAYVLINFLFVLAIIYIIIKFFKLDKLDKPK